MQVLRYRGGVGVGVGVGVGHFLEHELRYVPMYFTRRDVIKIIFCAAKRVVGVYSRWEDMIAQRGG